MRVIWFTNTPSLYNKSSEGYNGGGWIESLEKIVSITPGLELAVSFFHSDDCFRVKKNNCTYYPIPLYKRRLKKIEHNFFFEKHDNIELKYCLKVIDDFKPDLIHVFGTERSFGLLSTKTKIPVVIHIQGLLNPCLNAYFAPGTGKYDIYLNNLLKPFKVVKQLNGYYLFSKSAKREISILKSCKYFLGRTDWDKNIISLYSNKSKYFYCGEVLRDEFYNSRGWTKQYRKKFVITSVLSDVSYKGIDLILKTASLLMEQPGFLFEWNIYGLKHLRDWERQLKVKCYEINVNCYGIITSEILASRLLDSDVVIHPSYIDNSPNSLCEAQLLGVPVIATNVGGVSSLITDNMTGILVPANDPFILARKIIELKESVSRAEKLSKKGRLAAMKRHDKELITKQLLNIYKELSYAENPY